MVRWELKEKNDSRLVFNYVVIKYDEMGREEPVSGKTGVIVFEEGGAAKCTKGAEGDFRVPFDEKSGWYMYADRLKNLLYNHMSKRGVVLEKGESDLVSDFAYHPIP